MSLKVFALIISPVFITILLVFIIDFAIQTWSLHRVRPETYCFRAESDANNIAAAISDYFALPEHTTLPTISGGSVYLGFTLSSKNGKSQNIAWVTGDASSTITIVVQDSSGRCPDDYQESQPQWNSGKYTKIMN